MPTNLGDGHLQARPDLFWDLPRLLTVFERVCEVVAYAHRKDVVHRDLKPANVMLGPFGEVLVTDWGLARTGVQNPQAGSELNAAADTRPEAILGTPAYMPPEQARGEVADYRADVFGLGGILCAILTGRPPFTGERIGEVMRKAAAGDLSEAFTRLNACGADAGLITLAKRCLSPRVEDRPAHAGEVAAAVTVHRSAVEKAAGQRTHPPEWLRLTLAVAVGLLLASVIFAAW